MPFHRRTLLPRALMLTLALVSLLATGRARVLLKIPQLWSALADTFQTDLLVGDLVRLAVLARDLPPREFTESRCRGRR